MNQQMKQALDLNRETYGEIFRDIRKRSNFRTDDNLNTSFVEILYQIHTGTFNYKRVNDIPLNIRWILNLGIVNIIEDL